MRDVRIVAKWDDVDGRYMYNLFLDDTYIGEFFEIDAAYDTALLHLGANIKVEYD